MEDTRAWLILTTLPHLIAAFIAQTHGHPYYAGIITASTLASVAWHADESPAKEWTDLLLAGAWGLADTFLCPRSIVPNLIVAFLRPIMTRERWHLISAAKAIAVAAVV
jgi:hypothetical protein